MNFPLDTNVVAEWTKPRPDTGVVDWLAQIDEDAVFLQRSYIRGAASRH